jgi:hypothetical protein
MVPCGRDLVDGQNLLPRLDVLEEVWRCTRRVLLKVETPGMEDKGRGHGTGKER